MQPNQSDSRVQVHNNWVCWFIEKETEKQGGTGAGSDFVFNLVHTFHFISEKAGWELGGAFPGRVKQANGFTEITFRA